MSNRDINQEDQHKLTAYLDGTMSDPERAAFEARLRDQPALAAQSELQERIDIALRREFRVDVPSTTRIEEMLDGTRAARDDKLRFAGNRNRRLVLLAAAAAIAWAIVGWHLRNRGPQEPVFTPHRLVDIYQGTIAKGFEPYYECREPERFAATFATRLGQSLALAELPENSYMLGLSYPGGLSRMTTAMLCRVHEQPVIVFVDRIEADRSQDAAIDPEIHIFRQQRHGLVFYEVTPFPRQHVMDSLVPSN